MSTKEIITKIKIPSNFFNSDKACINLLKQVSNGIFSNSIMNGGKNIRKNKKKGKTSKYKLNTKIRSKQNKTKKLYKLKGGTTLLVFFILIIIFLTFNPLTTDSLIMTKDSNVISRIVEAGKKSLVFNNLKGTCASNILFLLKTISLETHVSNLVNVVKMTTYDIEKTPNIDATLKTNWIEFDFFDILDDIIPETKDKDKNIHEFFSKDSDEDADDEKKNLLVNMYIDKLQKICSSIGKGFITLFGYPTTLNVDHAVALWYTETGNVVLIDPQLFGQYRQGTIEIYSDINIDSEKYNAGSGIKVYSLKKYLRENLVLDDICRKSHLLQAKHFELDNNSTDISSSNPYYEKGIQLLQDNKKNTNTDL